MSVRPFSSISSIAESHSPASVSRLSARIYALRWASVRPVATTQGTSCIPSALAASTRPCPAMILQFSSIRTGATKPNSRRLARICDICAALWRLALFAYGTNSSMGIMVRASAETLTMPVGVVAPELFLLMFSSSRMGKIFRRMGRLRFLPARRKLKHSGGRVARNRRTGAHHACAPKSARIGHNPAPPERLIFAVVLPSSYGYDKSGRAIAGYCDP